MVITQEQKSYNVKKCVKNMTFYAIEKYAILQNIYILFGKNIMEPMTIISNINAENNECILINFLQPCLSNLTNFCLYSSFYNFNSSGTSVENTFAFRCPQKKKSRGVRSGSMVATRMQHAAQWDNHQIFVLNTE